MEKSLIEEIIISFEDRIRQIIKEELNHAISELKIKESEEDNPEFITVDEICKLLRISKPTLYNRMREGVIKSYRLGDRVLFNKKELIKSMEKIKWK